MIRALFLILCAAVTAWYVPSTARAADETAAELALRLPDKTEVRYAWVIASTNDSTGKESGKDIQVRRDKQFSMKVVLAGQEPATFGQIAAAVRFHDFEYSESEKASDENEKKLAVNEKRILQTDGDRALIDSHNDIGLEKISNYQKKLRNMERVTVRLNFDPSGKQKHIAGEKLLVETLQAGTTQGLFPVLAGAKVKPGESWHDRFELPKLGELVLDEPASVIARMKFGKWEMRDGKKLALIEVISAWESRDLSGKNELGLKVKLSELEGLGTGVCYFDPSNGQWHEGNLDFNITYRIEGERDKERTDLKVKGKTRFEFKRVKPGAIGAEPPPK